MKKTFPLTQAGRHPDRVRDALKHTIRKYLRRERGKALPEGADFLDFDCRFGLGEGQAEPAPLATLMQRIDAAALEGASQVYVEILARGARREPRPQAQGGSPAADTGLAAPDAAPAEPTTPMASTSPTMPAAPAGPNPSTVATDSSTPAEPARPAASTSPTVSPRSAVSAPPEPAVASAASDVPLMPTASAPTT